MNTHNCAICVDGVLIIYKSFFFLLSFFPRDLGLEYIYVRFCANLGYSVPNYRGKPFVDKYVFVCNVHTLHVCTYIQILGCFAGFIRMENEENVAHTLSGCYHIRIPPKEGNGFPQLHWLFFFLTLENIYKI